jgi:hypothetical protein
MNTKLKSIIEKAINKVIENTCEDPLWEGIIHPELVEQMTNACEQVFDSAMKAQEYCEKM